MASTKLVSPGIPNYTLKRNLKLQGNYISNDGGDEGITVDDAGDVGINIPTTITPSAKLEVFNSNVQYSTGTAYQSGTGIVGSGTTFTAAMVGGRFVFDDGTDAGIITSFVVANILVVSTNQTVGASDDLRAYKIYYPSVRINTGGGGTELKIGNTSFNTYTGDILLAAGGGGNIQMSNGTNTIFDFDVDHPSLTIKDDADTSNSCSITVGDNGATLFQTNDNSGASAFLQFDIDGYIKYTGTFLWLTNPLLVQAVTLAASGTTDYSFKAEETLNLSSGAGGSDTHYGIWYAQTQTDLTGWDSVYLAYISGGAGKILHIDNDANLTLSDNRKVVFGDAGEYIVGDGTDLDIISSNDVTIDAGGDIILDAAATDVIFKDDGIELGRIVMDKVGGSVQGDKSLTLRSSTLAMNSLILKSLSTTGAIYLDSKNGRFVMQEDGTEFSVANSAYAGMILGYTTVGIDAADDSYNVTDSFAVTDAAHKVKFVAPPSGVVEIYVSIYVDLFRRLLYLGLSDNATYNALDVTHEHIISTPPSSGGDRQVNHRWVITGLTAGTAYEYWLGAKSTHTLSNVLRWGGNVTDEYAPFIMKATALPTAVADYAVYG